MNKVQAAVLTKAYQEKYPDLTRSATIPFAELEAFIAKKKSLGGVGLQIHYTLGGPLLSSHNSEGAFVEPAESDALLEMINFCPPACASSMELK